MILESEALPFWELTTGRKVRRVGFITTDDDRFGCSPDGLIENQSTGRVHCGIEIKCPAPHTHVKYLSEQVIPKEYRAQVAGGMFATGFKNWIFFSYCRGFPPFILEVCADEKQQAAIAQAVKNFHENFEIVRKQVERVQKNPLNEFKR